MRTVLVANPKGGAGKTTMATNLSVGLASLGHAVALWDLDRQKSSMQWLSVRGEREPRVVRLGDHGPSQQSHGDLAWLVIDSPAALHGKNLSHALKLADKVVVPVQPSLFDMAATGEFLNGLLAEKSVQKGDKQVGVVGMRVDPRTRAASTLEAFLAQFSLPVLTYLRDTQLYANAAFNGLSLFDLPGYVSVREAGQWGPLLSWLDE